MRLISLELHNFRQHIDSSIEFAGGVTGIIGPNGAGKTTLLEAIAWALYGAPAVRGTNETLRSAGSEGGAKVWVKLAFELGGSVYTVTRTLDGAGRSGGASLELDGRVLNSGMSEVSSAVARLLGMDYQAFFTSFFTGQKQLEFMASLDGRARAAAISRMLGYERLSRARDQANQDRLGLQREIEGLERGLPDPEELKQRRREALGRLAQAQESLDRAEAQLKACDERVAALKPLKEASDRKAVRFAELTRRLEVDDAELHRTRTRLQELQAELSGLQQKRQELAAMQGDLDRYEAAREEYRKQAELQKFEAERQRLTGQISLLETEIRSLRSREKSLADAHEQNLRAGAALSAAEDLLRRAEKRLAETRETRAVRLQVLKADIERLLTVKEEIQEKHRRIDEAGAEGECPTCERPLAGELNRVLSRFESQLEEVQCELERLTAERARTEKDDSEEKKAESDLSTVLAEVERIRAEQSAAQRRVAELESVRTDLASRISTLEQLRGELSQVPSGFDQARFAELRKIGEELRPVRERAVAISAALEREPDVQQESDELARLLEEKQGLVKATRRSLEELAFSSEDHEKLVGEFDEACSEQSSARIVVERQRGEVRTARAVLEQVEQAEQSFRSKLAELNSKRAQRLALQTLAEALDRLRIELNSRIRPELESIASDILATITDGRYSVLEIDDSYRAVIRDDGELKPVISGGEEDVVNLALRLAVSQMIADRAGQSFSLLILDEVFGSLDESRRENVVALLQNLKNRFEQIILITHIESIHDAVDNCVWVEFDEKLKASRLTERPHALSQPDMIAFV